ncbi:MAG: aminotransferase class V-fold PLP-dependent enzyme [Planctomycetota bacterium]|nr:aminotransferase class V-fold PLP-dependent enzyme [Planctomycetota bacterium]
MTLAMKKNNRRAFLGTMTAGVAASCLGPLRDAQGAFHEALDALPTDMDFADASELYSLGEGVTYFNHASIGTMPRVVQAARRTYLDLCETNPWLYMWGPAWGEKVEETRRVVAEFIGSTPQELAIVHNTTEAFNTLASGLPLGPGDEVLFSSMNHAGASVCWNHHAPQRGFTVRRFEFPIERADRMTADEIVARYLEQIKPETRMLVIPHIDNMVGLRYPVKQLAAAARRLGVQYIAVDGAQSIGMIPVDVNDLGVDFYATSAHKWLQSPKGLGLLHVKKEIQDEVRAMWVTWGQGRWGGTARVYEDYGTRNRAELLTLEDCVRFQMKLGLEARQSHFKALHRHLHQRVEETKGLAWRSPQTWEDGCSLVAIEVEGHASGDVFDHLYEQHGFVFRAFGGDLNTMRISLNVMNTTDEIDRFVQLIKDEILA